MPTTDSPGDAPAAPGHQPPEGEIQALSETRVRDLLPNVPGWRVEKGALSKQFDFRNYHETMAFVNASAWVSHRQDHHPDLEVGYNQCTVRYSTHSVGGLSVNDFACAAKIDALFRL